MAPVAAARFVRPGGAQIVAGVAPTVRPATSAPRDAATRLPLMFIVHLRNHDGLVRPGRPPTPSAVPGPSVGGDATPAPELCRDVGRPGTSRTGQAPCAARFLRERNRTGGDLGQWLATRTPDVGSDMAQRRKALPSTLPDAHRRLVEELRRTVDGSGLSYAQLAERTHYSQSSWGRLLNGEQLPTRSVMRQLAGPFPTEPRTGCCRCGSSPAPSSPTTGPGTSHRRGRERPRTAPRDV